MSQPYAAANDSTDIRQQRWVRNARILRAARRLAAGGVVAYPTEAVWGLGCNPFDARAVLRLLELKGRAMDKGLILLAARETQLAPWLEPLPAAQRRQLAETWPGPVTWLVPNRELAPEWVTGRFETLALRVTDHPVAAALSLAYGGPIVSTSANPAGLAPARNALTVRRYFGSALDDITPGRVGQRREPSVIRDLATGRVLRGAS